MKIIGLLAGFCTTFAFLPQVIKVWRTRATRDISLIMYVIFCLGLSLWAVYGLLLHDLPLILANVITLIFALSILVMKIIWKQNK